MAPPSRLGRRTFFLAAAGGAAALWLPSLVRGTTTSWAAEPTQARVLIRRGDSSLDASTITVSGDGEFALTDGNGEEILKASAQSQVAVGRDGDAFWVQKGDDPKLTGLAGPIRVNGTGDGAPLRNQSTSSGPPTPFRGTLEVTASPGDKVALVNVLGLEEYIYGVVTKELPAGFGAEPLKAQAVAARTYAIARKQVAPHKAQSADVCDTQHCQAFSGLSGEHAAGRAAVDATRGRVLLYQGNVFEPYYSSACGGHTEAASRIFGMSADPRDADNVPDGEIPGGIELTADEGALKFFKSGWDSNCSASDRYRWSYSWDADQLKAMVASGIARFQGSQTVGSSAPDARVEQLETVSIPERGPSGRAMSVRFEAPGVAWEVRRDWGIRNFMRTPEGIQLPSSAIALELERGSDQKLARLTVYGAGWGHGAGLCQWGTRGLAARGKDFEAILAYYYPSAELGDASEAGPPLSASSAVPAPAPVAPPPPKPTPTPTPQPAPAPASAPAASPVAAPPPSTAPKPPAGAPVIPGGLPGIFKP